MNGGIGKRERWIRNLNRVFEWNIKLNGKLGGLRYSHSASSRAFKRSLRLLLLLLHSETSLEERSFFTDIDFSIRTADLWSIFDLMLFVRNFLSLSSLSIFPQRFYHFLRGSWERLIGVFRSTPVVNNRRLANHKSRYDFSLFFFFFCQGKKIYDRWRIFFPDRSNQSSQGK